MLVLLEVVELTVPVEGVPVTGSVLLLDEAVPAVPLVPDIPEAPPPDQLVDMVLGLSLLP